MDLCLELHVYILFFYPPVTFSVLYVLSICYKRVKKMNFSYFFLESSLNATPRTGIPTVKATNKLPSIVATGRVRPERTSSQPDTSQPSTESEPAFPTVGCAYPVNLLMKDSAFTSRRPPSPGSGWSTRQGNLCLFRIRADRRGDAGRERKRKGQGRKAQEGC